MTRRLTFANVTQEKLGLTTATFFTGVQSTGSWVAFRHRARDLPGEDADSRAR